MNWHSVSAALLAIVLALSGQWQANAAQPTQPSTTLALTTAALPPAHPERVMLMAIAVAGGRLVSVGESGTVALSDDDGQTWRNASQMPVSVSLTNVAFASAHVGWAIGHQGVVLRTDDGGEKWSKQADGITLAQQAVDYWTQQAAGGNADAEAALENARNVLADGPEKPLLTLSVINDKQLLVAGAFGLAFQSNDGGTRWVPLGELENEERLHLYGVARTANKTLMVGEQGLLLDGNQALTSPYEGSLFGVIADDEAHVVAYGLRGHLVISGDGGANWQVQQAGDAAFFCGLQLRDGAAVLGNQAGQVFLRPGQGTAFAKINWQAHAPLTGVVQARNGDLLFSSLGGIVRLSASELASPLVQNVGMNQ